MAAPVYKAEQSKDGNWTVYDVPIFSVHVDQRGGEPLVFSKSWLRKALKRAQTREAEGYYPPLHIRHHGDGDVKPAGKFRITRIADHSHGGRDIPTLFADLVGVRPEVYERIRRGELSYRSVEILDVDEPELDSLALLDDEVPFFRYPILKIGSEQPLKRSSPTPALAYTARGQSAALLFNFEGTTMIEQTELAQEQAAPAWAMDMLSALSKIAEAVGASKQEEEEEEEEEKKGVDIDIDADEEESEEEKARKSAPVGGGSPVEVGMDQRAAMRAVTDTVKSLRAELDTMKADSRMEQQASKLRSTGLGEDKVKKFQATYRKDGERAALVYAQALEDMRPTEPPRHFNGELRYSEAPDPKCVGAYSQQGPESLEKARSLHRSFKATQPEMSLERYMEINMDPDAFFARARTNAGRGEE